MCQKSAGLMVITREPLLAQGVCRLGFFAADPQRITPTIVDQS